MSEQRHKIQKQIIELHLAKDAVDARRLQSEFSRIYRRRIVPIIDQYCTELSTPDQLHQIDSLEIDLGEINPAHLETETVAKFQVALRKALTAQIDQQAIATAGQKQSTKTESQVDLLWQFAQTGTLPWWANTKNPHIFQESLHVVLEESPTALRALIKQLMGEKRPFRRFISHFNNQDLLLLVNLFLQRNQQMSPVFVSLLQNIELATRIGRQALWKILFEVGQAHQKQSRPIDTVYTAVLQRLAPQLNINYSQLLQTIQQQLQQEPLQSELNQIVAILIEENQTEASSKTQLMQTIEDQLNRLQAKQVQPITLWPIITKIVDDLPTPLLQQLQISLAMILKRPLSRKPQATEIDDLITRIFLLLDLTPAKIRQLGTKEQTEQLLTIAQEILETTPNEETVEEEPIFLKELNPDEVYIENAGLVILWPFLGHFFKHLNMVKDKQLKDAQTKQKAIALLHYIATESTDFPEYQLPLNKILAGVDLLENFELNDTLSDSEFEECVNLLTAVIAQAPILRNMSITGFRNTFLLREGVLRSRDGAWLLQVEHLTHDIVLDRFPWSWEWVKLPWMETALRVEW